MTDHSEDQPKSDRTETRVHQSGQMTQEMSVMQPDQLEIQQAALVLLGHPDANEVGEHWRLRRTGGVDIGRLPLSDVPITGASAVSRRPARTERNDGTYQVQDLGSTNGTYLNGEGLKAPEWLSSEDRLQVGSVHLKLIVEADVEGSYHQMMYSLAVTDPLTGVANRRRFEEELDREFARAGRRERSLGLMIIDVDQSKQINDHYGHPIADQVLKGVAAGLQEINRGEQTLARIGGDEFAILIPEASVEDLELVAERVREQVAAVKVESPKGTVTAQCSIGGAVVAAGQGQAEGLYAAADEALYQSERSGRARATITGDF